MADSNSVQPRFSEKQGEDLFLAFDSRMLVDEDLTPPPYRADTRVRDRWLVNFSKLEPHLQGVIHSLISIDANRGWELVGGRNQVARFAGYLHNWRVAPGLTGWRPGVANLSQSFYICDLGGTAEIGRKTKNGPITGFYSLDPTKCRVTPNEEFPLKYYPAIGTDKKARSLREMDFLRAASMPDIREEMSGVGYCFLSRAMELTRFMVAVWRHDQEEIGARAPRGFLTIQGVNQEQFKQAMQGRKAEMDGEGWKYFDAVAVLASGNQPIDVKLIALSTLPKDFDLGSWVNLYMYGLALCAGYDPSEFYPVQYGSLGRGTEVETMHEKATGKGGRNFSLALQEQIQRPDILPETVLFEFQERDEQAEKVQAELQKIWADVYKTMRETGLQTDGIGGISNQELRELYARQGMIDPEWTTADEPVMEDDEGAEPEKLQRRSARMERIERDRILSRLPVLRAAETFPDEPVSRYSWPSCRMVNLWDSGSDLIRPRLFPSIRRMTSRQAGQRILYNEGGVLITDQMVTDAIEIGRKRVGEEFASLTDNKPIPEDENA